MLLIACVLILLSFLLYKRHEQMSQFKHLGIPGPKPNLIFGNSFDIAKKGLLGVFPKWTKKYGSIVGFYIGGRPQVLITDFELIRRVLIKDFHVFANRPEQIPGGFHPQQQLRKILLWTQDNEWRQLRATMSPSFSLSKLNGMEPLMKQSIEKMVNELENKAQNGQEFNVALTVAEMTFLTGAKCILGLDLSLNGTNEAESFVQITRPVFHKSILAMTMLLFPSLSFIAHPLRVWWETLRMYKLWSPEGICYDITKKMVQVRKSNKIKSKDFLQLLIDAKRVQSTTVMDLEMSSEERINNNSPLPNDTTDEKLLETEIISNALLFLLAAYETTSVTLQFVIHNLVNNQDIQEKLRSELKQAINHNSGEVNFKTVSKVALLKNVIMETLRMYPPVSPFTSRLVGEDYEYDGIRIPKGSSVFIGVAAIHNDAVLWPEPEKFKPERFENEFDKLAYLPFGGGYALRQNYYVH